MSVINKVVSTFSPKLRKIIKSLSKEEKVDLTQFGEFTIDMWNKIKNYINPNVRHIKMSLSNGIKDDLAFLKSFRFLETIQFTESDLISEVELNILAEVGVKEVIVGNVILNYSSLTSNSSMVLYGDKAKIIYNGINVNVLAPNKISSKELVIEVFCLDKRSIETLLDGVEPEGYDSVRITTLNNNNVYNITKENGVIKDFKATVYDIEDLERFYSYIKRASVKQENISVVFRTKVNDAMSYLRRLIYNFSDESANLIQLNFLGAFNLSIRGQKIEKLEYTAKSLEEILSVYELLSDAGYNIEHYEVNVVNANKYRTDFDYEKLSKLTNKTKLDINYDGYVCSCEEFIPLVETIKWYRELLDSGNLSPVEKLMQAYDIVKSLNYDEEDIKPDDVISRAPHMLISDSRIVCAGYCRLFEEIFSKYDNGISVLKFNVEEDNHTRLLVRIDDDKYNLHGIFALDPTWDCALSDNDKKDKKFLDSYNSLDFYRFFLVPMNDYFRMFTTNEKPRLYRNQTEGNLDYIAYGLSRLFGEKGSIENLRKYSKEKRPSLESFISMLINVRVNEGYSFEEARKEALRVVEVNTNSINYENKRYNENVNFFESKNGNKNKN